MAGSIPVDRVQQLRSQGYQNSQIIDILQRDGFSSAQIFDALNQADVPSAGAPSNLPPPPQFSQPHQAAPEPQPAPTPMPELPDMPPPPPTVEPQQQPARTSAIPNLDGGVSTEEYVEAIIEEKWGEIEEGIQKMVDWKNRSEQHITLLAQQVEDLKDRFEKLHATLIGKIESYDKNILEVGAEIKAMEKVFSKVLPVFTDNVKQLSDITEKIGAKTRR